MDRKQMGQIYLGIHSFQISRMEQYSSDGEELRLFKGETLEKNQSDSFIFYIRSGRFKICVRRSDNTVIDFAYCVKGGILQINQFLMNAVPWDPAFFEAVENSVIIRFTREQFYRIICQDQELFNQYVDNASAYSTLLKQRLLLTSSPNSAQRVFAWLEKLCDCNEPEIDGVFRIDCHLTQKQVADLLFIHVTTCNKILSKLNAEHIAQLQRGKLTIWDRKRLQKFREENWKIL